MMVILSTLNVTGMKLNSLIFTRHHQKKLINGRV